MVTRAKNYYLKNKLINHFSIAPSAPYRP